GEQIALTFLDAVLHVATGAVDLLVEHATLDLPAAERVMMKRGLASPLLHSALATTRRRQLQLSSVVHCKSLKRRAGRPVRRLSASAAASSSSISATSRSLRARPTTKSTPWASHQPT